MEASSSLPLELQEAFSLPSGDHRFQSLVEGLGDMVWEIDEKGIFTYVNARVEALLGYLPDEVTGKSIFHLVHDDDAVRVADKMKLFTPYHRDFNDVDKKCVHRDGRTVVLESVGLPFFDASGRFRGYRGVDRDVTRRKETEEQIRHQAHHDCLTGLPNRILFNDRLNLAILNARRNQCKVGVIFIDLDSFKIINDTYGHAVGDKLLAALAERLTSTLRQCDTVARVGGDEFVVLLPHIPSEKSAARVAGKILTALARPLSVESHTFSVSCSLGISLFPADGADAAVLVDHADCAMYRAKKSGKRRFRFFNSDLESDAAGDIALEESLRRIIELDQLVLFYQPQLDIHSGKIVGMEALLRWQHPELGLLSPDRFLPLAEETGLIVPIGDWVLRNACLQNKAWQDSGIKPLRMSVNLSSQEIRQDVLPEKLMEVLRDTRLSPPHLSLDIPEVVAADQVEGVFERLDVVAKTGVHLSLDDFGTGSSSMRLLRKMPVGILKIHRSILRNVTKCPDDAAVVSAAIKMAHCLGLKVIAEGVETMAQFNFVRSVNCDLVQGFLVSPPLPADEVETFVEKPPVFHA